MAPTADNACPGRVERQHRGGVSTSWTGGRCFLLRVRYRDTSIACQHGSLLPKRDQFVVAVRTHHALSWRIEEEDQGRLSASRASDRLVMSSGLRGVVERRGRPIRLNHEGLASFPWPCRSSFESPWRGSRLPPSPLWLGPRPQDSPPSR